MLLVNARVQYISRCLLLALAQRQQVCLTVRIIIFGITEALQQRHANID